MGGYGCGGPCCIEPTRGRCLYCGIGLGSNRGPGARASKLKILCKGTAAVPQTSDEVVSSFNFAFFCKGTLYSSLTTELLRLRLSLMCANSVGDNSPGIIDETESALSGTLVILTGVDGCIGRDVSSVLFKVAAAGCSNSVSMTM